MQCYFYAAHFWLAVGATVFWGYRKNLGGDITQWTIFGVGRNFDAYLYPCFIGGSLALAAVFAYLFVRSLGKAKQEPRQS
ncbi:hypothetical protein [Lacipirellula sp.]|uniref:hypothetical protein n=1 Tax=Lacipirellula sp. TaxID=2691419 RepID=UPI003D0A5770